MTSSSTVQRVSDIILATAELPRDTPVTANTELVQAGLSLDSTSILEILLAIETAFGVELDAQKLFEARALRTVGSLASFVESRLAAERRDDP